MDGPATDPLSLAVTKLRPPGLSDLVVERPRITGMLDAAIESAKALALVSAPAGSGKSTALATWLAGRRELSSTWLQIDSGDNDPTRFWGGFVLALAEVHPGIDEQLLPALRAPDVTFVDGVLPGLVNTLSVGEPVTIVLDDYHLIDSPEIHDGVQALIDALPPQATLMVSSRIDPPLRLGRLRVRGQMIEVRADDLCFDPSEATYFFPDHSLDRADIETLWARTEGWAAGLALAATSLARSIDPASFVAHFAGDNRLVVDYLATELWDGLGPEMREVMLATSILEQMCGALVDAVAGIDHGAEWLEAAAGENQLLLSLDEHRHWYRYHQLLRDLLQAELHRARPDQVADLHRKAGAWFAAEGHNEDAIRHAIAGGDRTGAATLVAAEGHKAIQDGHISTLQGWLDQLGPEILNRDAGCAVLQVWVHVVNGRFDRAGPWLDTARTLNTDGEPTERSTFVAELIAAAAALTALAQGDLGAALAAADELISNTGAGRLTIIASDIVGDCWIWAGRFDEARPLLEHAVANGPDQGLQLTACTSQRDLAILALELDDPGRARHHAQQAVHRAEANHLAAAHQLALAHSVLGVTASADDRVGSRQQVDRGVELARRSNRPIMVAYALACRARVHSQEGRTDDATIDLTEARKALQGCPDPGMVLTVVARREAQLGHGGTPVPSVAAGLAEELTPRELTVLRLLPSRLNVTEIAAELYVSPNTVKGHVKAIYRKLGVNERALAVQRARELRLL